MLFLVAHLGSLKRSFEVLRDTQNELCDAGARTHGAGSIVTRERDLLFEITGHHDVQPFRLDVLSKSRVDVFHGEFA